MTLSQSINYLTLIQFSFLPREEKPCKHTPGIKYEHKVAAWLKKQGYRNIHVTPVSGDYGVDIMARKGRYRYAFIVVQKIFKTCITFPNTDIL